MDSDWGLGGITYEEGVIISLLTNAGKKWLVKADGAPCIYFGFSFLFFG